MALEVFVHCAKNLTNLEKIGKSDPYVILLFQGVKQKTNYISGNLNPEWNETFTWEIGKKEPAPDDSLSIWIKDYEHVGRNRLMGESTLLLRNALESEQPVEYELNLFDHNKRETSSTLFLTVTYRRPERGVEKDKSVPLPLVMNTNRDLGQNDVTFHDFSMFRNDLLNVPISANKVKFQVRVYVLEGRQLAGSNINPICQITLSQMSKQTQVAKATSNPWWNEIFFFNIECTTLELYKEILEFKVQTSRALRSDVIIGCFKLDLGQVYGQPQHGYINKWLLLKNNDEDNISEVMGYLKTSIAVIGPGNDIPDFTISESDRDDVESNLLLPTGAQLKPATFVLNLYQAADLPRMDPGTMEGVKRILNIDNKKELIDPYMEISFAGNRVTSNIIYGDDNPCWNEKLFIGFQFPSVCEKIQLVMKDWDRISEDDIIAVTHIPIPFISASGHNGFLPCFGPTWVNFYGAPREYSLLKSLKNSPDSSAIDDCCFRGRTLLSLTTDLGTYPSSQSLAIVSDDIIRAESFCRRRRFRLHGTFLDATMVNITDSPVEFEVSIGNFGNKFEDQFLPSPSTTQPTNAVFDGCRYYYLPWKEVKPSVVVVSQWEDCTFRLETLNLLNGIANSMDEELKKFSNFVYEQATEVDAIEVIVNIFLELTDFELPEPVMGQQHENELDRLLRKRRLEEIRNLRDQATVLRQKDLTLDDAIQEIRDILKEFRKMIYEPQNNIPDVIIWMLCGKKRIGYKRIPAEEVLFSPDSRRCGINCDKTLTLLLKKPKSEYDENMELPAVLRVKIWLGLEVHENYWRETQTDAALTVFAETYENQVNVLGNWTNKAPMTRPSWSDANGTVKLKPEKIAPPTGWRFEGDWFIDPEPSLKYSDDAGRKSFLEDVFENQARLPGGSWSTSSSTWTDLRGDKATPRDEIEPPTGWEWEDIWQADVHRAVDEEGWEYTVEATLGGYQPVERTYHLCRRRRWIRLRKLMEGISAAEPTDNGEHESEDNGWEYSTLFSLRFHSKKRAMDLVRRRRWHKMLVTDDMVAPLLFNVTSDASDTDSDETKLSSISCPRLSFVYKERYQMQLRMYIYQARNLIAGDKTGFSDPYVCVSFLHQSQVTEVVSKTLNPTWDQSIIFHKVIVFGNEEEIRKDPPSVVLELYDRDVRGDDEFLGRLVIKPLVQEDCQSFTSPPLIWQTILQGEANAGEILASSELFFVDDIYPVDPPKRDNIFIVPSSIRPVLELTAIEILCWGVRNMKTFELSPVSSPSVEFECGGNTVKSKVLKDARNNPNFEDPVLYLEMMLPQDATFMPPMNMKVRDHRPFGRKPVIGTHSICNLHTFVCQPVSHDIEMNGQVILLPNDVYDQQDTVIDIPSGVESGAIQACESSVDWWAKYYASIGEVSKAGRYLEQGYCPLKVFPTELERVDPYNNFTDFLNTFPLKRGITKQLEESVSVGEFKGTVRIYSISSDPEVPRPQRLLKNIPHSTREEVTVRVYAVKAFDLVPKDSNGKADPYIRVKLGKKEVDNRKSYRPNTLNPVFGEVFELSGTLPMCKDLTISVWDYDLVSSDDLIGETVIDLENRYLTKYRATRGLPLTYETSGINRWRDSKKPTEILEDICVLRQLSTPNYSSNGVVIIGNRRYELEDFEKDFKENPRLGARMQRLALHVLHSMYVVPEHIETRAIYNPASPDLQQGKIQVWVEIFPSSQGKPSPVIDISPRIPMRFELRIIIWNTYEVPLDEKNAISGDTMSDIYVKSIFADGNSRKTDVHYRSMDGEGNFNWRMVFPLDYLVAENKVVVKKKKHLWSLDETETLVPPKLSIQIWDDDKFSSDDFLGSLEFNLTTLPVPTKSLQKCGLHQLDFEGVNGMCGSDPSSEKLMNLFEKKRTRGFWPCYTCKSGEGYTLAGKVEMELELLTSDETLTKPAGQGRDEPNLNPKLEEPNRPATSFLWFTSPWKSFKFILWKNYKWYCLTLLIIFSFLLLAVLFIYSFPESFAYRLLN